MSASPARCEAELQDRASVFAALGDATRLSLVATLSVGPAQSITRLAEGTRLTRQAVTKHLRVLEAAGVVHSARAGRESRFALSPEPLEKASAYLAQVSDQWEQALVRLKAFVER